MKPTRRLEVFIDDQTLKLIDGEQCIRQFNISTAAKGMGFTMDSYRTPTGRFRVSEKIGTGEPHGTIFKARTPVGLTREVWADVARTVGGDEGARVWLRANSHRVTAVECADLGTWTDIDTPTDLPH